MKNRVFTKEHRKKISEALKGKIHTPEAKIKISLGRRGKISKGLPELQAKRWRGEGNPNAKTTFAVAQKIRDYAAKHKNVSIVDIAKQFQISYKVAYGIIKGGTYSQ